MATFNGMQLEDDVSVEILDGGHDATLDELERAVKARKKAIRAAEGQAMGAMLAKGDVVQIKDGSPIRPKYLIGVPMEVEKVNQKTASVHVVDPEALPSKRYAYGIRVPLDTLEQV